MKTLDSVSDRHHLGGTGIRAMLTFLQRITESPLNLFHHAVNPTRGQQLVKDRSQYDFFDSITPDPRETPRVGGITKLFVVSFRITPYGQDAATDPGEPADGRVCLASLYVKSVYRTTPRLR